MKSGCRFSTFSAFALSIATVAAGPPDFVTAGVDANYSLGMEADGRTWQWNAKTEDLFRGMAARDVRAFRVRLWTGDDGVNGKSYATEVVRRALAAGMDPYLVIFLSEDWADLMKQPAPAKWKNLDLKARAVAVKDYSREVVRHFRKEGLRSHLYEIGNEIDYGICGVYPGKSTKKNPETLSRSCWPQAAELIRASQEGVREADPDAKFLLHIAHWWDEKFCIEFFRFMLGNGVQVDYAGLSYFPSANIGGSLEMEQFGAVATALNAAIDRPIIVPETAYPSTDAFKGQFGRWKKETPGYPLTPDGQRRWLEDFLAFCSAHPAIEAVYYWSPEWYGEGMWKAFALFDPSGEARPAWAAFDGKAAVWRSPLYLEVRDGRLTRVPIDEARKEAVPILKAELAKAGRVNTDYIKAVTEADLTVDGYRVNLRASLTGNLDLIREDDSSALGEWKALLEKCDPVRERIVVFSDREDSPLAKQVLMFAQARGLQAAAHVTDKPLKFGFGNDWQDAK